MATVTIDATSQRYTSSAQPEPDILLLHTTEGMSWPGYGGGGSAPHDTIRAIPRKGIEVRRHYPYDQFAKALENDPGGVETNRRGVIQVELRGTCDPKRRDDPDWYYWPDADDAVLSALADYYRPIMARYGIPARAMAEFVAYPKSYGDHAAQRLSWSAWNNGAGIAGHQHVPENAHGDPGNFPIARFIAFLPSTPAAPQEDPLPSVSEVVDGILNADKIKAPNDSTTNPTWTVASALEWTNRNSARTAAGVARLEVQVAALATAVEALAGSTGADPAETAATIERLVRERLAAISVDVVVADAPAA